MYFSPVAPIDWFDTGSTMIELLFNVATDDEFDEPEWLVDTELAGLAAPGRQLPDSPTNSD